MTRPATARAFVGLSGWSYPSWRAHVYQGVPARAWLPHIAGLVDALEINGSGNASTEDDAAATRPPSGGGTPC